MPESLSAFCVQIKEVPQKLLSQKMKKMKLCHVTDVRLTMLLLLFSLFIQYNSFHGFQLKRHQMYQGIDAIHHQKLIHKILVLVNILFRYMKKKYSIFQSLTFVSNLFSLQRQENLSKQFYYDTQSILRRGFSH